MRTIGLIGGMSWESTAVYYQLLNRGVAARLGGLHSARLCLWSMDFGKIAAMQAAADWASATRAMVDAARAVERGGAECLVICTNTMHLMADEVAAAVSIPLLHIADATGAAAARAGVRRPLLLATRYTMEEAFYRDRLRAHGVEAAIPPEPGRSVVHDVIYEELCRGMISDASRARWMEVVDAAATDGADGVIFGCTEVGLLLRPEEIAVPCFDSAALHVEAALDFALADGEGLHRADAALSS